MTAALPFGHTVHCGRETVTVALAGPVDINTSGRVNQVLRDAIARGHALRVELSRVTCLDTAGVATLIGLLCNARRAGLHACLVSPSDPVRRTLALFRLESVAPAAPGARAA